MKNILEYLEKTEEKYKNKLAFVDNEREVTWTDFVKNAKKIGCSISGIEQINKPIAIFIDKTVSCLEVMFGVLYSGNFYTIIDTKSPKERINLILNTLEPSIIVTDEKNKEKVKTLGIDDKEIYIYEDMIKSSIDDSKIEKIRKYIIDTDPMYVLFTSGSTGTPKGTVISHKAVVSYATWVVTAFKIDSDTIWGSQTPFYFSMSITDVFSTIMVGATFYIIPKMYFSFPVKLLGYINEKKINTIYWVPSALCIVANFKALEEVKVPLLKKVLFAGEVMPVKQLNMWMDKLPNAVFANLFGPTETTDICTYYVIDRKFKNEESLPIGKSCDNCDVLIIKEDGTRAEDDEAGELCVRGSFLANGYYNNPEKTNLVFVQNPLNNNYPEIIYKTGDIVKYNNYGELIYLSRKDFQIKHMGYRIELGEIENAANSIDGIIICACVYDVDNSMIVLFYQGDGLSEKEVLQKIKTKVPIYMCPNKIIKLHKIPYNANGKIDRVKLKNIIKGE